MNYLFEQISLACSNSPTCNEYKKCLYNSIIHHSGWTLIKFVLKFGQKRSTPILNSQILDPKVKNAMSVSSQYVTIFLNDTLKKLMHIRAILGYT
jgi:hypothetical protein